MLNFLSKKFGEINDTLIITEVNRDAMRMYKEAYSTQLNKKNVKFDTLDFLENDNKIDKKIVSFMANKKYKFVFLLAGTIASAKIANYIT